MENTVLVNEIFDFLYLREKQLTSSQLEFIQSVKKQFKRDKTLSEKQIKILKEIRKYLLVPGVRFSGSVAVNKKQDSDKIFIVDM